MRSAFTVLFLLVCAASAQLIPADRRIEWEPGIYTGVYGGIPTDRTMFTNLLTAGGSADGVTDNAALLQSLVNTCPANKYVYIPETNGGVYYFSTHIYLHANNRYSIVGGSRTNTWLFPATGKMFFLDNTAYFPFRISSAIAKGATNFSTAPGTDMSGYVGNNVKLSGKDDGFTAMHVIAVDNTERSVNPIMRIVAVNNLTNVTVWPPVPLDFPIATDPWLYVNATTQSKLVGIESLGITGTNFITEAVCGVDNLIVLFGAQDFWFKDIRVNQPRGFHFNLGGTLGTEIRDSDFIMGLAGANTAIILMGGDGGALVENNYAVGGSPFVECNGSIGNAVAYNYVTNAVSNDFHVGNPYDNHSPHSAMNLFEGNWGTMYQSDSYFGSSSHNTTFRNWFTGHDYVKTGIPRAHDLGRWSEGWNSIANVFAPRDWPNTSNYYNSVLTAFATPWYETGSSNQFYTQTQPVIYRNGFPFPGNTSFGHTGNPKTSLNTTWNDPGTNMIVGVVTQATALTNIIWGAFTSIPNGGVSNVALRVTGTDHYYPKATNYPRVHYYSNSPSNLWLTAAIWVTNGDTLYTIGPDAYNHLDTNVAATLMRHGNYDVASGAIVWDREGYTSVSNIPISLLRAGGFPSFMTNSEGDTLDFVNPTNGYNQTADWQARIRVEEASLEPPPEPVDAPTSLRRVIINGILIQ